MKKWNLTMLAVFTAMLLAGGVSAEATEPITYTSYETSLTAEASSHDYYFTVSNGKATITDFNGSGSVVIPAALKDYPVVAIGNDAFADSTEVTSVVIPDGVISIGDHAFANCTSLASVTLSKDVTSIGKHAFSDCHSLASISIPESVLSIGDHAFFDCSALAKVDIAPGVASIGMHAFSNCTSLVNLVIPEGVLSIGEHAFAGCTALTKAVIPEGVTAIGTHLFSNCRSLASVVLPDGLLSIGNHAFADCTALTQVEIPATTTSIGDHAFVGCASLPYIIIPSSTAAIGNYVFADCLALERAVLPEGVVTLGRGVFYNCSGLLLVDIPSTLLTLGSDVFAGCTNLKTAGPAGSRCNIEFAWDEIIPACAFDGAEITKVTIPDGIVQIGFSAFANIDGLDVYFEGDAPTVIVAATSASSSFPADTVLYHRVGTKGWEDRLGIEGKWYGYSIAHYGTLADLAIRAERAGSGKVLLIAENRSESEEDVTITGTILLYAENSMGVLLHSEDVTLAAGETAEITVTVEDPTVKRVCAKIAAEASEAYAEDNIDFCTVIRTDTHPYDFNGDGTLDIKDALALFRYSMLPDFYPIPMPW